MKGVGIVFLILGILLFSGCTQNNVDQNLSSENSSIVISNNSVNVSVGSNDVNVNIENGAVKIDNETKIDINTDKAQVVVNGTSAVVNYGENKSVEVENLSINQNNEGTYEINMSVKNNITLPENVSINSWCIANSTYDVKDPNTGAVSNVNIVGIDEYRNKTFCKSESKTNVYGIDVLTTYYFDFGAKDVWAVVDMDGVINEVHITNN